MTTAVGAEKRRALPPVTLVVLALSGVAWVATIVWILALDMSLEAGTMGLSIVEFVVMWTLMMAAMMLPAVSPLVSMYARSVRGSASAVAAFGAGYLLVWASTGVVAYVLTWLFGELAEERAGSAHGVAVAAFVVCGAYQLTPMKRWCLRHCRSPISHLLHYAAFRGRTRHLRAGAHHGLVCVGCCWGMMLALLAVSMMNLPAMVVLGVLITLEKQWRYGETLAKVVGVAALVYAAAIAIDGDLAPGSIDKGGMDEMEMDEMEMDEMEMDEMEMDDPMALPS
jgi:predicted metal-binding membrane protein